MKPTTKKQMLQEEKYIFPYHYLDLSSDFHKNLKSMEIFGVLQIVEDLIKSSNKKKINFLDAGCGDGRFCYELKTFKKCKIVGIDYSEQAIGFAKAFNPNIEFFVQDLEKLNLPCKFDIILLNGVLDQIIPSKIPSVLSNLDNVLKEDGKLIIVVRSKNVVDLKHNYQHFTKESLANTLNPYFKIENIRGYLTQGYNKRIFDLLGKIGVILYPFSKRISFLKSFYVFRQKYFFNNISRSKLNECKSLIAILSKYKKYETRKTKAKI